MMFTFTAKRGLVLKLATLVLAVMPAGISCQPAVAAADEIRLGGTGAGLTNIHHLGEAFVANHPGVGLKVVPSLGSSDGIKALLAGGLDVSVSARSLKEEESAKGALAAEYARTPFVFATRSSAATGFSRAELVRIYAGDTTTWPDGTPMRIVMRPTTDSDTQLLRSISEEISGAVDRAYQRPGMIEAATDQENADALESVAGSVGTSTLGQMIAEQRHLRALALEGVEPTVAAAASGRYPMFKILYVVMRKDASPLVREFVEFVQSPAARPILERQGYWVRDRQPSN